MALFLGFFALTLVMFMVFAMALAEWADQDPGDLWQSLKRRWSKATTSAAAAVAPKGATLTARPSSPALNPHRPRGSRRARPASPRRTATRKR
jgi:hypothetical protein